MQAIPESCLSNAPALNLLRNSKHTSGLPCLKVIYRSVEKIKM